jgi:hypothetical protein
MTAARSPIAAMPTPKTAPDSCPWCGQPISHEKFEQIQAQIAVEERQRTAESERQLIARVALEKEKLQLDAQAKVARVTKEAAEQVVQARADGMKEAEAAAARKVAAVEEALAKANADATKLLEEGLRQQREVLDKAKDQAVNAEKAKSFKHQQRLDQKIASLQRQVQRQTADELGEGAEVDLFEALKGAFPEDEVSRVKKGTAGADIVHKVVYNKRVCGQIVYDSKNRDAWRNDYVTKLRQDQLAARADHAVLSTRVFPAGSHQLHLLDGVIVANPARVIDLVQILRRAVLSVDSLRMSGQERDEKSARLYEFITSQRCTHLFEELDNVSNDLLDLDVKETAAHENVWKRRGSLIRSVQRAQSSLTSEIEQIIGTAAQEDCV